MVAVVPTIILDGLILAFVSSASSKLMPVGSKKLDVGIFLIIMGAGCIVGGYCSGHLSDILKMKNAGKLSIILIFLISTATALLAKHLSRDIAFILAVFWGIVR
jgi:predicted MFS family arabinose efflux permease